MSTATAQSTEQVQVKVGDFFVCSWGYDQTNVDFYKVVGMTASGKSVKVQKWTSAVASTSGVHDNMVEGDGPVMERGIKPGVTQDEYYAMDFWDRQEATVEVPSAVMTKRLRVGGYKGASFNVNSYSDAYLWDGTAQYQTGAGYGH